MNSGQPGETQESQLLADVPGMMPVDDGNLVCIGPGEQYHYRSHG